MIGERYRVYLMGIRQCLIMLLGLTEDYLEVPRSIVPRRKRDKDNNKDDEKIPETISRANKEQL